MAALTLDDVENAFYVWRMGKRSGATIPSSLWDKVAAVANQYTISKICQRLRISYPQYNENVLPRLNQAANATVHSVTGSQPMEFVNVAPLISAGADSPGEDELPGVFETFVVEFTRRDGLSAKCHCSNLSGSRDLLAWFLRGE